MPVAPHYRPDPVHLELGPGFSDAVEPARFPKHRIVYRNNEAAAVVGLDTLTDAEWTTAFARFEPLPGNLSQPRAWRYHGHQFRHYNPDLGDGRGFLYAQLRGRPESGHKGTLYDLGTKGSGTTPWSRSGDGRLTLQGGVREVLAAERLDALGTPTCKILSLIETGEPLHRHDEPSPTRSAVMVRMQRTHIRIGTFQRHAYHRDTAALSQLAQHVLRYHYPHEDPEDDVPEAILRNAAARSADTLAAWMAAGFVHGVLNTDNICITGDSFDYGPWRFLEVLDPAFTAAYFDHNGLYAYGRQPDAVRWNLSQLALALSQIGSSATLSDAVEGFHERFRDRLAARVLGRLGIAPDTLDADRELSGRILTELGDSRLPFDRFFYDWLGGGAGRQRALAGPLGGLYERRWFRPLRSALEDRSPAPGLDLHHPAWQHKAPASLDNDTVRACWARIAEDDDWSIFSELVRRQREEAEARRCWA